MMIWCSYLIPLLLIISAPAMVKPQTAKDSKQREKLASMIMDCQKTTHASLADLNAIREKRMPSSHEGQCMIECVFSATKIMKNGNYDKAGALQVLTPYMRGDAEKTKKLTRMLDTCEKEIGTNSDKCTTAKKIAECTQKHGKEFGFQMPVQF